VAVVVDTANVPPDDRFAVWSDVSAQVFEPLAVAQLGQGPFAARLEHYGLGALGMYHMWADASSADRTPRLIRSGNPELFQLMVQLSGACWIAQDDRRSIVRPGELTSWHSSSPYCVGGQRCFEALIVYMPVLLLRPHVDRVLRRTALRIDGEAGVGAIVRQYVLGVLNGLQDGSLGDDGRGHLAEGLVDLMRALLTGRDGKVPAPQRSSDVLRGQVLEHIDANLGDPALCPEAIAREHFISRSYLYRLFEDEGASVAETIRTRRLERSRRDLADAALDHESIFDIASRWGFVSKSHFSRAFRAAYGQAPSDFRRDALRDDLTTA
jgi:AraC-like DNA-binding protein